MKAVIMMFLLWFRKSCDTVVLKSDTCSKQKSFTHAQNIRVLLTMGSYKNFLVKSVLFGDIIITVMKLHKKRQILNNVSNSDDRCLIQSVIWWDLTGGVELDYTLSRSLAISNFLNRKWAAEVEHFRPRPPAQSKIGDSSLSFFSPSTRRHLGRRVFSLLLAPESGCSSPSSFSDWRGNWQFCWAPL